MGSVSRCVPAPDEVRNEVGLYAELEGKSHYTFTLVRCGRRNWLFANVLLAMFMACICLLCNVLQKKDRGMMINVLLLIAGWVTNLFKVNGMWALPYGNSKIGWHNRFMLKEKVISDGYSIAYFVILTLILYGLYFTSPGFAVFTVGASKKVTGGVSGRELFVLTEADFRSMEYNREMFPEEINYVGYPCADRQGIKICKWKLHI